MDISYFCDSSVISEYLRIKGILERMPRYSIGMHAGKQVIREYTGYGDKTVRKTTHMKSQAYGGMQQKMNRYNEFLGLLKLYEDEIKRRHLTIPEKFEFKSDSSVFNIDYWNSLIPTANSFEIKSDYYDNYGYHVRSRGEMIIGNALKDLGLEAKYEPLVILKNGKRIYPDYSFPVHVIDRCFFVEFVGMTDNEDYCNYNYGKIDEYMRNGILPNRDLILICGTNTWLPSQDTIKHIIASFINTAVESVYKQKS